MPIVCRFLSIECGGFERRVTRENILFRIRKSCLMTEKVRRIHQTHSAHRGFAWRVAIQRSTTAPTSVRKTTCSLMHSNEKSTAQRFAMLAETRKRVVEAASTLGASGSKHTVR